MEAMEVYLHTVGHVIALIVQAIALFLVAAGAVEATRRLQHERQAERSA